MGLKTCAIEDCDKPHRAYGWCHAHYMRWYRTGDPEHVHVVSSQCGTYGGYQRHRKDGEPSCRPCLDAMNAYNRERRRNLPKRTKQASNVPEGTPRCEGKDCGRPMMGRSTTKANLPEGWSRRHNDTTCTRCYDKARRARKAAEEAVTQQPAMADPALEAFMRKSRERKAAQQRAAQIRRKVA